MQARVTLRRAALTIFGLIAVLPILLFTFFMWRFERLHQTEAQVGVLLAVLIALLGFVLFRQLVDRVAALSRAFEGPGHVAAPKATPATLVPGLGEVAEIGDIAQAFSRMLTELRGSTERLEDLVFKLGALNEVVEMAAKIPKIEDLLSHVLERTMRAVSARIGSIMLLDRERKVLRVAVGRGLQDHPRKQIEVKVGEGIAGKVVELGEPVLVENIETDPRFGQASDPKYGGGSFICMPLRVGDHIVGVVNLAKKEFTPGSSGGPLAFTQTDLQFLNALMTYAAYAIDNARLFDEAQEAARRLREVVEDQQLRLTLAQRQMIEAAKLSALGELVAGVAHELSNPLMALFGVAELLERSAPQPLQSHVRLMWDALESAQHVVRGLLTFARRVPLERTPVNLAELVDKVLALMAGDLRLAGVEVETDLEPDSPPVCADRNQLQQVLVNLIANAKHALAEVVPSERRLRISLRRAGLDTLRLQVEDNGPGIPADLITKVFDPFVTTKTDGTGLGLSISYGIVREHDGRLSVESPPGHGATFTIELPIGAGQELAGVASAGGAGSHEHPALSGSS
jgi:signal transduction histidine kinase